MDSNVNECGFSVNSLFFGCDTLYKHNLQANNSTCESKDLAQVRHDACSLHSSSMAAAATTAALYVRRLFL